jgi:predicted AAA+ superfamily ATPase
MIERDVTARLLAALRSYPAVLVIGPRQSGKTMLCREGFSNYPYVNLQPPETLASAENDPRAFLSRFPNGAILDGIYRCPDLISHLSDFIDEDPRPGRWILIGSHDLGRPDPVAGALEGRVGRIRLLSLSYNEEIRFGKYPGFLDDVMFTGSSPRILARHFPPGKWYGTSLAGYLDRDVRAVTNVGDLDRFQRFMELCAGTTAQLLNLSSLADDCGISQPTAKKWLSVLESTFVVFRLLSYSGSVAKRLVKTPKLHFYDTGLVCWLLGIRSADQLAAHPFREAVFKTWVVSEIVKNRVHRGENKGVFHYRDRQGTAVDIAVKNSDTLSLVRAAPGTAVSDVEVSDLSRAAEALGAATLAVYGGDEELTRSGTVFVPWRDIHGRSWTA